MIIRFSRHLVETGILLLPHCGKPSQGTNKHEKLEDVQKRFVYKKFPLKENHHLSLLKDYGYYLYPEYPSEE